MAFQTAPDQEPGLAEDLKVKSAESKVESKELLSTQHFQLSTVLYDFTSSGVTKIGPGIIKAFLEVEDFEARPVRI